MSVYGRVKNRCQVKQSSKAHRKLSKCFYPRVSHGVVIFYECYNHLSGASAHYWTREAPDFDGFLKFGLHFRFIPRRNDSFSSAEIKDIIKGYMVIVVNDNHSIFR